MPTSHPTPTAALTVADLPPAPPDAIRLNKLVRAPREHVFQLWTDPAHFNKWFAPGPKTTCDAQMDVRVGGSLRFAMNDGKNDHIGIGEYTAVDAPNLLAFTWSWETMPDFGAGSLVTVHFFDAPNPYDDTPATEVVLTHERLGSAVERSEHIGGWWDTLRALGYYARGVEPREAMHGSAATQ
ncbi:MAG: SRPBCC domain-containing protein [Planctomycetota bacterium]